MGHHAEVKDERNVSFCDFGVNFDCFDKFLELLLAHERLLARQGFLPRVLIEKVPDQGFIGEINEIYLLCPVSAFPEVGLVKPFFKSLLAEVDVELGQRNTKVFTLLLGGIFALGASDYKLHELEPAEQG